MEHLTSLKNPKVLSWRSLKDRKGREATGCFLVEGWKMTEEALSSGFPVEALLLREGESPAFPLPPSLPLYLLSPAVFASVCDAKPPQGIAAALRPSPRPAAGPRLIALDQVQDPGNVGTLARTLYAMGGAGLVLPKHNSAFLGPGARRSAAGALERLPVAQVVNLARAVDDASEQGFFTFAARKTEQSMDPIRQSLPLPALLVLGSEEKGIRPNVARRCAGTLGIPFLREFDSLNVAQAGAVLITCFSRSLAAPQPRPASR